MNPDGKTEAQRRLGICPKLHSEVSDKKELKLRLLPVWGLSCLLHEELC